MLECPVSLVTFAGRLCSLMFAGVSVAVQRDDVSASLICLLCYISSDKESWFSKTRPKEIPRVALATMATMLVVPMLLLIMTMVVMVIISRASYLTTHLYRT